MGERTSYTPGTFSWADLSTTDQGAAKSFYGTLFGWEYMDVPVDESTTYSMAAIGGKTVAAISPQPQQQRDAGVPPLWNSYITVESADAALERARELGATVHADAFEVMDAGRMGVVQDPHGAYFMVWEAKANIGASLVNAPGALSWNELATSDMDAAAGFYSELFGWKTSSFEGSEMPYYVIARADGGGNGGIRQAMEQEPNYWLVYFGTEDVEGDLAKAGELGGRTLAPAMSIGVGTIGIAQDPQGGVFALYGGDFEP